MPNRIVWCVFLIEQLPLDEDGMDFDPHKDPRLIKEESSGTFVIPNTKEKVKYQGKYRCYASNKLGTAISEESEFIVPSKSQSYIPVTHYLSC